MDDAATEVIDDRFCEKCGYNLRGLKSDRCPECGQHFDPAAPQIARIPWLRRARIGAWRAYWQTVFAVTLHPIRFAGETANPVWLRARDAERFRLVVVWTAAVSISITVAVFAFTIGQTEFLRRVVAATVGAGLFGVPALVFFSLATSTLPVTGARSGEDSRLHILNCYCSAPWALLPFVLFAMCIAVALGDWALMWMAAFSGVVGLFLLVWLVAVFMLSSTAYSRAPFALEVAIIVPCVWVWSGIAAFALGALITGAVMMFIESLNRVSR